MINAYILFTPNVKEADWEAQLRGLQPPVLTASWTFV